MKYAADRKKEIHNITTSVSQNGALYVVPGTQNWSGAHLLLCTDKLAFLLYFPPFLCPLVSW